MNHRRSGKCIAICAALEGGRLRAKAAHPRRWSFQMEVPRLVALDASKGAIRNFLLCRAISDDVNRELAAPIYKHCNTLDRLAPGPQPQLTQAVVRQIFSRYPVVYLGNPMKTHPTT
jgi:hypothetical protein